MKTTIWISAIAAALSLTACGGAIEIPTEGKVAWTHQFRSEGDVLPSQVAVDGNGNVYVAGMTGSALAGQVSAGAADAFLRKYDSAGQELWTRQFGMEGMDIARVVSTDPMGNVYVGGSVEGALPGQTSSGEYGDSFIRKYDSAGVELWTRQFETPSTEFEAAWDAKGNVYVVGFEGRDKKGAPKDHFIRKKAEGKEVWTTRLPQVEYLTFMVVDEDGNVYLAGETNEPPLQTQFSSYGSNVFISKHDPDGRKLWTELFELGSDYSVASIAVDDSGGVYVAGWTDAESADGSEDHAYVRKFDASGKHLWTGQFPEDLHDMASSMAVDTDGNVYVVGWDYNGRDPSFVRKYSR